MLIFFVFANFHLKLLDFFQNEAIFVKLDELDKLDRIAQLQKTFWYKCLTVKQAISVQSLVNSLNILIISLFKFI